jgi:decaprenylphospho-beta-D-erythro-pentofuranosid-2-ulose 2-reductase
MNNAFSHPQSIISFGGGSDISRAIVRKLAAPRCHHVVLAGRTRKWLDIAGEEAKACGVGSVEVVEFDANDVVGVRDLVDRTFAAAGGTVDLVIVAVGILGDQDEDENDPARTAEVLTVDFVWPAAALSVLAEKMKAQGSGHLVVLSSVAGVRVRRANFTYGSAKAGLDGYCQGMAEALRGTGVTLQLVRPGFVRSKMTEGRAAAPFATTPDEVATAVVHGLETSAPVVWAPSILRYVFGVFKVLPQAVFRRLPG